MLVGALVPLADLVRRAATDGLGPNPISEALNRLGLLALIMLVASLACTPLRLLYGFSWPIRLRRMLGLLAFGYATLHFGVYLLLERRGALDSFGDDVVKRPFITVGMAAWLLLVPLAATSTAASVKRLGAARWRRLHRLAYVAAGLGALHFIWRVKSDVREPIVYALLLAVLLSIRILHAKQKRA